MSPPPSRKGKTPLIFAMKIIMLFWGGLNFCNARLNSRKRAKIPTHCGRDCHFSVKNGKAAANCPKFHKQYVEDWQNPSKYRDFLKLQLYRFQKVTPRITTDFANSIAHVQICCAEPRPRTNCSKIRKRGGAIRG